MKIKQIMCVVAASLMATVAANAQNGGGCGHQFDPSTAVDTARRAYTYDQANAMWANYCNVQDTGCGSGCGLKGLLAGGGCGGSRWPSNCGGCGGCGGADSCGSGCGGAGIAMPCLPKLGNGCGGAGLFAGLGNKGCGGGCGNSCGGGLLKGFGWCGGGGGCSSGSCGDGCGAGHRHGFNLFQGLKSRSCGCDGNAGSCDGGCDGIVAPPANSSCGCN